MNRNWQAVTPAGTVAVKQVIDATRRAVRTQHVAVTALARAGLPVPAPVAGPAGVTVLEHPAGLFTVLPWAAGRHRSGLSLGHDECGMLGALLGGCMLPWPHAAVAREEVPVAVTPVTAASERMARYLALAGQNRPGDDFDRLVLRRLGERAGLLETMAHLRPADQVWAGPAGWTHGDFHHLQVLWDGGRVSAVLDWDRLGYAHWRPKWSARARCCSATATAGVWTRPGNSVYLRLPRGVGAGGCRAEGCGAPPVVGTAV